MQQAEAGDHIPNTYTRNGIYYASIEIDGEPIRESLRTRDPVEARERLTRWLAEKSPRHCHQQATFAEIAGSWVEAYQSQHTAKTWRRYRTSLRMLAPTFGNLLWMDVTRPKLVEYMNERRLAGTSVATINRDLAVMSNIFEHAIDQGWATENLVLTLSKRARREKRRPFVIPTDAMIDASFARGRTAFVDLCIFALETGMRLDEIVQLRWEQNILLDRKQVQLFVTKNHSVRVVNLGQRAVEMLTKQKTRSGYVFVTDEGTPYRRVTEMWRDRVRRVAARWDKLNPEQPYIIFRFHDLRHLFAIRYLRNGGNIYHLQIEMGHSTIRQTEEYLQYLTAEEQLAAKGHAQSPTQYGAVLRAVN